MAMNNVRKVTRMGKEEQYSPDREVHESIPDGVPSGQMSMTRFRPFVREAFLLDEDWQGVDRFEHAGDLRHPVPLPEGVACYTIAANIGTKTGDLFGDGMVTVNSALGRHEDPKLTLPFSPSRQWSAMA